MSRAKVFINFLEKAKPSHDFNSANLWYYGISRDINGNKTAIFSFADGRRFSIQTLGNLPTFHKKYKQDSLDLSPEMEREAIDYIRDYGTANQKSRLKVYSEKSEDYEDPQTDDIFLYPTGSLGSKVGVSADRKNIGVFNSEDEAEKAIVKWINKNKFYPNIWWRDDHGGYIRYGLDLSNQKNIKL